MTLFILLICNSAVCLCLEDLPPRLLACLLPYLPITLPKMDSYNLKVRNTPARSFGYFIKTTRSPILAVGAEVPASLLNYYHYFNKLVSTKILRE